MITVNHLTKRYGSHLAVDDISFTVQDGEIVGFLGPNGAGKSTTMNMLTGYISSSSGEALINDINILDNPIQAKREIGYLPELPPLYQEMTVMGIRPGELNWEALTWERETGLFLRRGRLRCRAYFLARAEEGDTVFLDFRLKGAVTT